MAKKKKDDQVEETLADVTEDAPVVLDGDDLPDVELDNDGEVKEEAPAVQLAPTEVERVSTTDVTRTWGPFDDYQFVQTSWGEYGVPRGKVLFFREEDIWDNKAKRVHRAPMPYYVNPGEPLIPVKSGLPNTVEPS